MNTSRSFSRAVRAAGRVSMKPAGTVRSFAVSARANQAIVPPEIISAKTIQHTSYEKNKAPVREHISIDGNVEVKMPEADVKKCIPLKKEVYESMNETTKRMTVYGKTVIVTG